MTASDPDIDADDDRPLFVCPMCAEDFGCAHLKPVCRGECEMCGGGCRSDDCAPWPLVQIPFADSEAYFARRRAIVAAMNAERRAA